MSVARTARNESHGDEYSETEIMRKLLPATLLTAALASSCASGPIETPIIDTAVSGDPAITSRIYGKYSVLKGSPVRRLYSLEVSKSNFGKPVFRFFGKNGEELAMASPRSCAVKTTPYMISGNISCGIIKVGLFGKSDYPYIDIDSAAFSNKDPSDVRIIYDGKPLEARRDWYVLTFQWSDSVRKESFLIQKID